MMATNVSNEKVVVQEKRTLTLNSSDNKEFMIVEPAAFLCETIKKMVKDDPTLSMIHVPVVGCQTLSKLVNYLNKHVEAGSPAIVDENFFSGEEVKDLLDLSLAFHYLYVKGLLDIVCQKIGYGIKDDFTPEEEEELRQNHAWVWEAYVDPNND